MIKYITKLYNNPTSEYNGRGITLTQFLNCGLEKYEK